jgi:DNA-binding MarR family transcriptional regulator/ribosomal protein S18 acetylase RimI-like enzyme
MAKDKNLINKIRHFNRFYTQILGLLNNKLLKSDYSLTEARILFEFGQKPNFVSRDLVKQLHLDPAYLSRILMRFSEQKLIRKEQSLEDTRKQIISLTPYGESVLLKLQEMSNLQIISSLADTAKDEQVELVKAMERIEQIYTGKSAQAKTFTIRSHRSGDIGYIIYRHAIFYSKEYGFDNTFDAYVASAMAKFVLQYDPQKDHLWIVESDTTFMGSIAIVKSDEEVAQLRWFLIEVEAKGKGLGKKLLNEAIEFCKRQNYKKIILWTVSNLEIARKLYTQFGFAVTDTKTHYIWGQNLTEECWELKLNKGI